MSKNSKTMKVPIEFQQFIEKISFQVSRELGMPKNMSQTMRLMASNFEGRIVYKDKKFDVKIF